MLGNDHWTLELDRLGMKEAGDELARTVLRCRPPYAICVQGKWGSGKTSLMRYAMARLGGVPLAAILETSSKATEELPSDLDALWRNLARENAQGFVEGTLREQLLAVPGDPASRSRIVPIWFNPWQHQSASQPVVALLQEIRHQFTYLVKLGSRAKKLTQTAVEAGLPMLGELIDALSVAQGGPKTGSGKALGSIRKVGEAYEARNFESVHDAQRIHLLFREAVARLLKKGKGAPFADGQNGQPVALQRLVIFIDDLDRCADDQTVRLLEAIKLYLQTPNCVFVFGMDAAAARRAVVKVHEQGDEVAREYLEKLFQTSIQVPLPAESQAFVEDLLHHHSLAEAETDIPTPDLAAHVVDLVEPNPRKLKNFVNGLASGWRTCGGRGGTSFRLFLLLSHLRSYHPDVYRLISYDPSQVTVLAEVIFGRMPDQSSPVAYFFYLSFRHAFEYTVGVDGELETIDAKAAVKDLVERLDRHKGDRAFLRLWKGFVGPLTPEEVADRFGPLLVQEADPAPEADP